MIPQINILCAVDVIAALTAGSLKQALFMVDNHPANGRPQPIPHPFADRPSQAMPSSGLGTPALRTNATYAQVLNWHVVGIDFQTDARIEAIRFYRNGEPVTAADTPCLRLGRYGAPSGDYWAGVVNVPGAIEVGEYQYKIEFSMSGRRMIAEDFSTINVLR